MKSILKALLCASSANAAAELWDYKKNGADWGSITGIENNICGTGTNQSPINLITDGWPLKSSNFDNFNKVYTDQTVDVEINWNGHTSQVDISKEGQNTQTITSEQAKALGMSGTFNGVQFHFHAGSEHTVDGKRQDLEMHTVHLPVATTSGFEAAAMGIMFSVNNPTPGVSASDIAIIDEFFESLQWDEVTTNPKVEKVPYGKLMMMFDMRNRWTYRGSVTTPPCAQNVYWNVLRTIYPIKQKYVDQFHAQLNRLDGLKDTGNWRVVLPLTSHHNPVVLYSNEGYASPANLAKNSASSSSSSSSSTAQSSSSASAAATQSGGVQLKQ